MSTPSRHTAPSSAPSSAPPSAPSHAPAKSAWGTSSLSALAKSSGSSEAKSTGIGIGTGTGDEPLTRSEFAEFKAMILAALQSKDQGMPSMPQPSQALNFGIGRGNAPKAGILSQLSASIGNDGLVPRNKTSPSTPRPARSSAMAMANNDDNSEDLLDDVNIDGKMDEPSAKTVEDAKNTFIGPSQVKNIEVNHLGKYMIWFRTITWKDGRNRREANTICRALDAFLGESVDPNTSIGFEILARRLAGLIIMNEGKVKNPSSVADQLEYRQEDSMLPHRVLTAAVKTSAMYERVTSSSDKSNKWNNNNKGKGNGKGKGTGGDSSKTSGATSTKS